MHRSSTPIILTLLLLLIGLGLFDALLTERSLTTQLFSSLQASTDDGSQGIAKYQGPDVREIVEEQGFSFVEKGDVSLLEQLIPETTDVMTLTILKDSDRAGAVTWLDSGNVKTTFIALKDALLHTFSTEVSDVRDETLQEPGQPVYNILTFQDPKLSEERITFVRVRERLYEFHMTPGKEDLFLPLIDALTR